MSELNWVKADVAKTWPKWSQVLSRYRMNDGKYVYGVSNSYFFKPCTEYLLIERPKETVTVYWYRRKLDGSTLVLTCPGAFAEKCDLLGSATITEGDSHE